MLLDVREDLDYAKAHVPTNESSYGVKVEVKEIPLPPAVQQPGSSKSTPTTFKPTQEELGYTGGDRLKLMGNVIYELSCRNQHCVKPNCDDADHLGWAVWDSTEDMMLHH
jgi:hypothetical protein